MIDQLILAGVILACLLIGTILSIIVTVVIINVVCVITFCLLELQKSIIKVYKSTARTIDECFWTKVICIILAPAIWAMSKMEEGHEKR